MAEIILTRAEAQARGLMFYLTGKPCKHGHIAKRKTVNGTCHECHQARIAKWRIDNAERIRESDRAHRAKTRKEHIEKDRRYRLTGPTGLVFPSIGVSTRPMSENTMNQALRRMGVPADQHSSHGFRATASTLLNGSGKWAKDVVEISLSHKDPDTVRSAYARGEFEAERKRMAQWWADNVDQLRLG